MTAEHEQRGEHHPSQFMIWLPTIAATLAATASLVGAVLAWSASQSATEKDYVQLAMSILSNKDSSLPAKEWAASVISDLSPVKLPDELRTGLVTGKAQFSNRTPPNVIGEALRRCLAPLYRSKALEQTPPAPVPKGNTDKEIAIFMIVNRRPNGTPDRRAKGTPFQGWCDGRGTRLALRAA